MHDLEPIIAALQYALDRMAAEENATLKILDAGDHGKGWLVAFRVASPHGSGDTFLIGNILPMVLNEVEPGQVEVLLLPASFNGWAIRSQADPYWVADLIREATDQAEKRLQEYREQN